MMVSSAASFSGIGQYTDVASAALLTMPTTSYTGASLLHPLP
jgi:hypothetical protein